MSLKALFYARFHPERGPSVIHQYPPSSIATSNNSNNSNKPESAARAGSADTRVTRGKEHKPEQEEVEGEEQQALFNFIDVSGYVIPPYEVCNRGLRICVPRASGEGGRRRRRRRRSRGGEAETSRVQEQEPEVKSDWRQREGEEEFHLVTFPISIENAKYERNRFTFNVCFVLSSAPSFTAWELLAEKTGLFFRALEIEEGLLAAEEASAGLKWAGEEGYPAEGVGVVYALLKGIWEQVGSWGECCVPVAVQGLSEGAYVLNLRVGEAEGGGGDGETEVEAWHVPLLVRDLPAKELWTWDLVLRRIMPLVDGVRHIRRIAREADVDEKLVKLAVRELIKVDRCILLDVFHFQAVYMLTREFGAFVRDEDMVEECWRYVTAVSGVEGGLGGDCAGESKGLTKQEVVELYSDLKPGRSVFDFCLTHRKKLAQLDIRRFVTFAVIKGFVRRQQSYCLLLDHLSSQAPRTIKNLPSKPKPEDIDQAWKKAALSSGWATPPATLPEGVGIVDKVGEELERRDRLREMLDGRHCLDEICLEMGMSEKKVRGLVEREFGEVVYLLK